MNQLVKKPQLVSSERCLGYGNALRDKVFAKNQRVFWLDQGINLVSAAFKEKQWVEHCIFTYQVPHCRI
jgi:hypothetical protein